MKFSFIIPVHNAEIYLEKCIQSICVQSYLDYEIILVENASTDRSGEICDAYAKKYPQIKVIHQKEKGVSMARNTGVKVAQGEYFLFVDSDDVWTGDNLGQLAKKCKNYPDIVAFEYQNFYREEELKYKQSAFALPYISLPCDGKKFLEIILRTAVNRSKFYQWNAWIYCYNKKFFTYHKFEYPTGKNFEDLNLTWRVLLEAESVDILPKILYGYRKSVKDSITKIYDYKNVNDRLINLVENMKKLQQMNNISTELKKLIADHFSEQYFIVLTMSDLPATKKQRKKLIKELKKNVWISQCSLRKDHQFLAKLIKIFGIQMVCAMLHLRRKIVYHGQFKRVKE